MRLGLIEEHGFAGIMRADHPLVVDNDLPDAVAFTLATGSMVGSERAWPARERQGLDISEYRQLFLSAIHAIVGTVLPEDHTVG
jgi:hypothetical protein